MATTTAVIGTAAAMGAAVLTGCSSNSSHPPKKDVTISSCRTDANTKRAVVTGFVTNHTSKRSSYVIQVEVNANDSTIETGLASVFGVNPNASKSFTVRAVGADVPSGTNLSCKVARVTRTAT